jgi:hypothetical protein
VDRGFSSLLREAASFKRSAFAESTKAAYRTHMNSYLRFCLYFRKVPVPAESDTLKAYSAFLARSIKPAGIGGYLNIVRIMHLEAGLDNPLKDSFELRMIKRGISRQLGTPALQKLPVTVEMLRRMYPLCAFESSFELAFWAALLIGFFGLIRKSSLLLKNSWVDPETGLCRCDIVN